MEVEHKVKEILTSHPNIMALEKKNLTEERGKYVIICKTNRLNKVKDFIACISK